MNQNAVVKAVEDELREDAVRRVRLAFFLMAVPLVTLFSVVDYLVAGRFLVEVFAVRLLVAPVALFLWCTYRSPTIRLRYYTLPAIAFCLFLGVSNTFFIEKVSGLHGFYAGGLNLVCIGLAFLNLPPRDFLAGAVALYAPYFIETLRSWQGVSDTLVSTVTFMCSTIVLSFMNVLQFAQAKKSAQEFRMRNQELILSREREIERAKQHAATNERFAQQFSPQVREALLHGDLNFEVLRGQKIAFLFIDVADSTTAVKGLDRSDAALVLCKFYTACQPLLLQHGLTLGKQVGDGFTAWAGAPISMAMPEAAALRAAIDILKLCEDLAPELELL